MDQRRSARRAFTGICLSALDASAALAAFVVAAWQGALARFEDRCSGQSGLSDLSEVTFGPVAAAGLSP